MKTLKTTLGLFALSTFLFSFAPQATTDTIPTDSSDITETVQLEQVYQADETIQVTEKKTQE